MMCLLVNRKAHAAFIVSTVVPKLKDVSRSKAVVYIVKVAKYSKRRFV